MLKSLIRFHSAIKSTTIAAAGGKKSKRIYRISQNKTMTNSPWVTAVRVLSFTGSHSPPRLPRMPSSTVLVSGPAVGQLRFSSGPTPLCSCLQCPQLLDLVGFPLWALSVAFYILHRHRVSLADRAHLICSLCSWWEGLGSSSLAPLLLGFNCGFLYASACGSSTGFAPKAALEDLGLPLCGPGVEEVQLLGSQGFWQHQVLRGVGG